ncbi:hypothetical protein SCUCBS95973_003236 [Sporothrix curviconia]|uniref:RNase H type-1 domain-containing protein n=1 Tax=Sporothrix curviconia TaxID=1260050 RepID=A0ABP0BDK7_9PEZI
MPKRTRSGEPIPIFGRHPGDLVPAHLKLDLHVTPPSGNGQQPDVVASVRVADTAPVLGRSAGGGASRPQELSLTLKVRVVVGDCKTSTTTFPPICDILEASWSDASISQGLRGWPSQKTGLTLRQREVTAVFPVDGIESRPKRQKKLTAVTKTNAEAQVAPPVPQQAPSEALAKPIAAKAMGSGKGGAWTATVFKATKAALRLTDQLAPGHHTALPCSSRPKGPATYSKTLVLAVDGSSPEVGEAVSVSSLRTTAVGDRNIIAGWAFSHNPGPDGVVSGQLDPIGRDGEPHAASRNRADLMAVLAALEHRDWAKQDSVDRLVLATASYHMMKGLTGWLREWKARQWHTGTNAPVQNRDLWQRVNDIMGDYATAGCEVSVCHVPRAKFGTRLEAAAKRATRQPSPLPTGLPGQHTSR